MMEKRINIELLVASLLYCTAVAPANAEAIDYTKFFQEKVMHCLHPTVNTDKATYEIAKGPSKTGETTTVRFRVFYTGLVGGKNVMDADLMIREAGSIRQAKVNVLSDTGKSLGKCQLADNWADI